MKKSLNANILLLGPPGAGKGTQAKYLEDHFGLCRLDVGSLIREAIRQETELGKRAKDFVAAGRLIPNDLVIGLTLGEMNKLSGNFLLDGYPRNLAQAEALEEALESSSISLDHALEITLPTERLVDRIAHRRLCSNKNCGAVYHLLFAPPKMDNICDLCGSPLYQRDDDKIELVQARLETYYAETLPLSNYYRKRNKLITIDGDASPSEVWKRIIEALNQS